MFENQSDVILVVGDSFCEFAKRNNAITSGELLNTVCNVTSPSDLKGKIILGQGINHETAQEIISEYKGKSGDEGLLDITEMHKATKFGKNVFTHKAKICNVIIGHARRIGDKEYQVPLLIDDNCELLQDHQTGLHVQGIMLVEAFRQAIVAITEEFLCNREGYKTTIVVNYINTTYNSFIFPLPTDIVFKVINEEMVGKRTKLFVRLEAWQNNEMGTYAECEYQEFSSNLMNKTETRMASSATKKLLDIF
ncbi:AfsA-related hotdog domain-containing protein [Brenneria populi subsp. brevivirga]|uniref:AfsA-related hotdog domain-containing protein n=1 Tax=Brenneria populi TaxID=1505588 RepID=UPI002E172854|nr:AfsA-related hotdog domain-containing protein [Brenneria populi subsp. brevivirga]